MEELQISKWSTADKSGDDIFQLLGLKKAGNGVFESPVWSTWVAYLNKHEVDADQVMFTALRAQYGDERLTKLVAKASEVASTKEIAAKLQLDVWHMNGQTSDEVVKILKLDKMGDKLLESPELKTWVTYVRKLNSYARPNEFSAITQLEQHGQAGPNAREVEGTCHKCSHERISVGLAGVAIQEVDGWGGGPYGCERGVGQELHILQERQREGAS